jgi:Predicted metal-binding integral membrane protein (DUF2182)
MAMLPEWSPRYAGLIFIMWVVMMAAMMLPSAAPTILLVGALFRNRHDAVPGRTALFASGYLLVWCGFSAAATLLQWGLGEAGLLSETMALGNMIVASVVLIAAGAYQWTPLKDTCLTHCRSPADFLVRHWRPEHSAPSGPGCATRSSVWAALDADDAAVCRRPDEPGLGGCNRAPRSARKDDLVGRSDEPAERRGARNLGRSQPRAGHLK